MVKRLWIVALAAAFSALSGTEARAQDSSWYSSVNQGYANNRMLYNHRAAISSGVRRSAGRRSGSSSVGNRRGGAARPGTSSSTKGVNYPAPKTIGGTTFIPVAPSLLPQELARTTVKDPSERQRAEQFFSTLLDTYKDLAREKGALPNDVARAASFMIGTCYTVLSGRLAEEREAEALREQMREVFAENEQFQGMSSREKQEIFESYAIMGMYLGSIYQGATKSGDEQTIGRLRELARRQLNETLGAPFERVSLTNAGIVYR